MADTDTAATSGTNHTAPERWIWVRSQIMHTPAHRIINPARSPGEPGGIYELACPPYKVEGGLAITEITARTLEPFPCMRCFPAAAARVEQARTNALARRVRR